MTSNNETVHRQRALSLATLKSHDVSQCNCFSNRALSLATSSWQQWNFLHNSALSLVTLKSHEGIYPSKSERKKKMAQKIGFINPLSWYKGEKGHWKKNHCDWISSVTVANLLFTILMTGNFCFNPQPTQHHSVFSFIHYSARHMSRILQNSPFATAVIKFQIWNTFLTVPFEFQLKKKQRNNTDS